MDVEFDPEKGVITIRISTWIDEENLEQAAATKMMIDGYFGIQRDHRIPGHYAKVTWARPGWGAEAPLYEVYTITWAEITVEKNYDVIVDALFPHLEDMVVEAERIEAEGGTYGLS